MKTPCSRLAMLSLLPLAFASLSLVTGGCAVERVYLQDLRSESPLVLPPVHVAADSIADTFRFSPRVTFNTRSGISGRIDGHSLVGPRGVYEVDSAASPSGMTYHEKSSVNTYQFRGKNLVWDTPKFQVGLDMEYAVSKNFALTGFVEYARNTETDFLSMGAGMALLFGQGAIGGRLEGGLLFRDVGYNVRYVITSKSDFSSVTDVYFRSEIRKDRFVNLYGSLTLNTRSSTSLVNALLSVGLSGGSLVSFSVNSPSGGSAGNVEGGATILSVSPGIFVNLGGGTRFLTCVRFVTPLGVDDADPSSFIMPMAKLEFSF